MTRAKNKTITLITPAVNNICAAQTTAGATALLLNGTLTTGGVLLPQEHAWRLDLTSTGNLSAVNFVIVGTDADGAAQSETKAGPNNNTVTTTKYFKSIASITPSGAVGTNVTIGTTDELVTNTIPLNFRGFDYGVTLAVDIAGTVDFTVQELLTDPQDTSITKNWLDITALASKTADTNSSLTRPTGAVRFKMNSFTASGAAAALSILER